MLSFFNFIPVKYLIESKRPTDLKEQGMKHHPLETRKLPNDFFSENNGLYLAVNQKITVGYLDPAAGRARKLRKQEGAYLSGLRQPEHHH
jgi:hypothetical protein